MQEFITTDYAMGPQDLVVNVDPGEAYVEITLPYVGEATGRFYSINNFCSSGNTVHVIDRGDSLGFTSPSDLITGGALIYFSNGIQWLLVFDNGVVV
jgi:hypothetical protein